MAINLHSGEEREIYVHVRRSKRAPVKANFSPGAFLDNANGKQGMEGQRMIHVLCPFWKSFFSGLLSEGLRARGGDSSFPPTSHGFISERRREEAMLTQRVVAYKLDEPGEEYLTELMDMGNTFTSAKSVQMLKANDDIFRPEDVRLVEDRAVASICRLTIAQSPLFPSKGDSSAALQLLENPRRVLPGPDSPSAL